MYHRDRPETGPVCLSAYLQLRVLIHLGARAVWEAVLTATFRGKQRHLKAELKWRPLQWATGREYRRDWSGQCSQGPDTNMEMSFSESSRAIHMNPSAQTVSEGLHSRICVEHPQQFAAQH